MTSLVKKRSKYASVGCTCGGNGPGSCPRCAGGASDWDDDAACWRRAYTSQVLLTPVEARRTRHVVRPVAGPYFLADVELVAVVRVGLPVLALREIAQRAVRTCKQQSPDCYTITLSSHWYCSRRITLHPLFIPTPSRLLWEAFSNAAITA